MLFSVAAVATPGCKPRLHEFWVMSMPNSRVHRVARIDVQNFTELPENVSLREVRKSRDGCKQQWAPVEALVAVNEHCVVVRI